MLELDGYDGLEEIGRGMAIVYKATQRKLSRTVELKVLPEHLAFNRQFSLGYHYLAMEFVDGLTLVQLPQQGLAYFVALALEAARRHGNLVLSRSDSSSPLWSSETKNSDATALALRGDGILRLSAPDGRVVWKSECGGDTATCFQMQDDGNAVVYRQEGSGFRYIWATQSAHR